MIRLSFKNENIFIFKKHISKNAKMIIMLKSARKFHALIMSRKIRFVKVLIFLRFFDKHREKNCFFVLLSIKIAK